MTAFFLVQKNALSVYSHYLIKCLILQNLLVKMT